MMPKTIDRTGLARALSKSGYCSRSAARGFIREGRVRLNGRVVRDPERPAAFGHDVIEVDGHQLTASRKLYLMMNKPRGVVTTARDEKGRATVYSLLPKNQPWVAPVGRLDKASEGLLLLTNDSEWGARITSPETHVAKTYHVQVAAVADASLLERLSAGVRVASRELKREEFLRVSRAAIVRTGKKNSWIEIVLDEGKNRQIRRLLEALGIEVLRLVRISIGTLQLGELPKGSLRELTLAERTSFA